jgi:glycerol-3-phosphate acyltransferase PlsX
LAWPVYAFTLKGRTLDNQKITTVAIDAMGGDHGLSVTVPAALSVLNKNPELSIILVGDQNKIAPMMAAVQDSSLASRIEIIHTDEVVAMDESPSWVLRNKKNSSMRLAINQVKEGRASACVSAGNTGALMATARFVLKTLPGIDRPAIIKTIPSLKGVVRILDLGANIDCSAKNLYQFALMGSIFAQVVDFIDSPKVALLNVGQEEIKGNEQVKEASTLLSASSLNYIGYIEGDGVFKDMADVVVCDGFVGNISLKVIEGLAKMIAFSLKQEFNRNFLTKVAGFFALPVMKRLKSRLDPGQYNGATFIGLRGVVIKSHGSADSRSFAYAIEAAMIEAERSVPEQIERKLREEIGE